MFWEWFWDLYDISLKCGQQAEIVGIYKNLMIISLVTMNMIVSLQTMKMEV